MRRPNAVRDQRGETIPITTLATARSFNPASMRSRSSQARPFAPRDLTEPSKFPNRDLRVSTWQTDGGLPWQRRSPFKRTSMPSSFGRWPGRRPIPGRFAGCWRWPRSTTAAPARRRRVADGARLGSAVQCRGSGGPCHRQGAGQPAASRRGAAGDAAPDRGGRADPGHSRRRALALGGPGAMGLGGVPGLDLEADAEPGAARDRLPQAVGSAVASRQGRGRRRGD